MTVASLRAGRYVLPIAPNFYAVMAMVKGISMAKFDDHLYFGATEALRAWSTVEGVTL